MKLYASEAQVHQLADILFRVRRIRMQRAQSRERPVRLCNFGRDKAVDAGDLMRRGGNRVDQIMGDPHLPADPVKRSRGAVVGFKGKVIVKLINAFHRLVCDGVRVDMAVRVKDPAGDLFVFRFHGCNVLPMWIFQIRGKKRTVFIFPVLAISSSLNQEESVQKFIQSV